MDHWKTTRQQNLPRNREGCSAFHYIYNIDTYSYQGDGQEKIGPAC